MPDLTSRLIVELVDRVTGNAQKTAKGVKGITDEMKRLQDAGAKFSATRDMFGAYTKSLGDFARAKEKVSGVVRELQNARKQIEQFKGVKVPRGDLLFEPLSQGRAKVKDLERQLRSAQSEVRSTSRVMRENAREIKNAFGDIGVKNLKQFTEAERTLRDTVEAANKKLREQHALSQKAGEIRYNRPIGPNLPKPPKPEARRQSWWDRAVTPRDVVAGAAGLSVTQALRDSAGFILDWEREGNRYRAQGGGTLDERRAAEAYANELGRTGKITPYRALGIQTEVMKAGYSGGNARALTGSAVDLALYGGVDPLFAAETLTAGLSQYNMPRNTPEATRTSSGRLADIIAFASAQTQADVQDVANVFRYVGPLGSALDLTPEHIAAMYMQQAQAGLKGPEAGTAIRDMLVKMIKPTIDGQSVLAENNLRMSDYVTGREPLNPEGFIAGAERKFGPLDSASAKSIKAWLVENADAAMEDQIKYLASSLEGATKATGPQDKERTAKYAAAFVNSSVNGLNYDALMTDLIDVGLTPTQIARLFTGKHVARDMPILTGEGYQRDLKRLQTEAPGSAARQSALQQEGLPGAWDRFMASLQASALNLDALTKASSGAAAVLDALGTGFRVLTGGDKELGQFKAGAKLIGGNLMDWVTGRDTFQDRVTKVAGDVGDNTPGGSGNAEGKGSLPAGVKVTADTAAAEAGLNQVTTQLSDLNGKTANPQVNVSGVQEAIQSLQTLLGLIMKVNSTPVNTTGMRGAHADLGAGTSGGW